MFARKLLTRSYVDVKKVLRFSSYQINISAGKILYNKFVEENVSDVFMYSGSVMP